MYLHWRELCNPHPQDSAWQAIDPTQKRGLALTCEVMAASRVGCAAEANSHKSHPYKEAHVKRQSRFACASRFRPRRVKASRRTCALRPINVPDKKCCGADDHQLCKAWNRYSMAVLPLSTQISA